MKKWICIFLIIALSFCLGYLVRDLIEISKGDTVAGVYQASGKTRALALYKDGTCEYPSGGSATWVLDGDIVRISLVRDQTILDGSIYSIITVSIDSWLSDAKVKAIEAYIRKLDNIESVELDSEFISKRYKITLSKAETDGKTLDTLSKIEDIEVVSTSHTAPTTIEYEAKIMENGLVLGGQFFEKVSN